MKGRNQYILHLINLLVFILLEAAALWLIARNSVIQRSDILKSVSAVTNAFSSGAGNIGRYFSLGRINRRLSEENVALRRENDRLQAAPSDLAVPDSLLTAESPLFDYIPALVVSNSTDRLHNILIINKGERDGITEDMGGRVVFSRPNSGGLCVLVRLIAPENNSEISEGTFSTSSPR